VNARRALLARLIDHAALFPPASLPLPDALEADRRARATEHAWMLDRFIVPASLLSSIPRDFAPRLSVIVTDELPPLDDRVEFVETRDADLEADVPVFVEVPPEGPLPPGPAKVRCGGEAFPSVEALAHFVAGCHAAGKPFKATAGLHHPLRTPAQHGFLNLLAAAVFAHLGEAEITALLAEEDPSAFTLDDEAFTARGQRAAAEQIAATRRELFIAYGSCSFSEPVEDLQALGML
jgi:hypothetical protein